MSLLKRKHGSTAVDAKNKIRDILDKKGYGDSVEWDDMSFSSSIGFGMILSLSGKITDDEIVVEECSGAVSEIVLNEIKKML